MTTLTPYEIEVINLIEKGIITHVGKGNAVTSKYIISKMKERGYKINGAVVRNAMHYLRTVRKHFICGDNLGYYIASNAEEKEHQIKSLSSRIREITEVRDALIKIRTNKIQQESLSI